MLFQLYSEHAVMQIIGWVLVFVGLIVMNELGRRTKTGGMIIFVIIPAYPDTLLHPRTYGYVRRKREPYSSIHGRMVPLLQTLCC